MSVIKGGTLVTGDGKTVIKNAYVRFDDGPAVSQRREAALQREGEFTPQEAAGTGNHHDP